MHAPCLYYEGSGIQAVIANGEDYEYLRRRHAPPGEYEQFIADGLQTVFQLSYQPISWDGESPLHVTDIIIYVESGAVTTAGGEPIVRDSQGQSNHFPLNIREDSIVVYWESPYEPGPKVHYSEVLSVDPQSGAVTFVNPPAAGSELSMSAQRLFDTYQGRSCNMDYFKLEEEFIAAQSVSGNGCLVGVEDEVVEDAANERLVYRWERIEEEPPCPAIGVQLDQWHAIERPPEGYDIVFRAPDGEETVFEIGE